MSYHRRIQSSPFSPFAVVWMAALGKSVVAGGAAAAAGIRPGEAITKIDDRLIASGDELVAAIRSYPPGSQVDVVVGAPDGSNQRTVQVTLGTQTLQAAG